jgi:hypothetical protein
MKTYLFLLFTFFTLTASAENWLNHSKILAGSGEAYSIKSTCENVSHEKCYDLGSYPGSIYSEAEIEVDDYNRPILSNGVPTGSYEKKFEMQIVLDQGKLSTWQSQQAVEATARQKEAGLQVALKKIDCGKRVIALLVLRNVPKGLTPEQVAQMNTVYAPIKGLLETASLVTAKAAIEAVTADGLLITDGDKADLSAETQKCIDL